MNDQTIQLLRDLAEKLGTTIEHLWSVLVTQAFISGMVDLIFYAAFVITAVYVYRSVKKLDFEFDKDGKILMWLVYWFVVVVLSVAILISLPMTFASFFNPEYWALKAIMR